jgi:deoxyribose-phosphate aldolase
LSGFQKDVKISIRAGQIKDLLKRIRELREKVIKSGTRALTKRIEAYGSESQGSEKETTEKIDQGTLKRLEGFDLPARINLVNLRPKLARKDLEEMADAITGYGFRSAIVSPIHVEELLKIFQKKGIDAVIIAAVGYPFNTLTQVKEFETEKSIRSGAQGVKTVMDIAALRQGVPEKVLEDLQRVIDKAREVSQGVAQVDVILDAALLREGLSENEGDQLVREATEIILRSGAQGISLNTGWKGKAEARDIVIVREVVGPEFRVAASGGVRTLKKAIEMIDAGADLISSSDAQEIILEYVGATKVDSRNFPNEKLEIFDVAA